MAFDPFSQLTILNKIGQGGFGEILLASTNDGRQYAIKKISRAKNQAENIAREARAGLQLSHKNIVHFVTQFDDADNDYLVFEYVKGMDMFSLMEQRNFVPFNEREAKSIFLQLLGAVEYCHMQGVIHYDIKLDNMMVDPRNGHVTLIDFGLCDFITPQSGDSFTRRVGSEEYCAPELYDQTGAAFSGTKVDIWCLGVVLYALLSSTFPFDPKKRKQMMRTTGQHPALKINFAASEQVRDLITRMLNVNPGERLSMDQVKLHPWIMG